MLIIFGITALAAAVTTLYFTWRSREFRKFLSGAFFVSAGVQLYLSVAGVSVPLVGTDLVQTPAVASLRAIPHFIFFLLTFYYGFIKKPREL